MRDVRRSQIAEIVKRDGHVKVSDLANQFDVSEITIHRDLDYLEEKSVLRRSRGGAIVNREIHEFQYPNRVNSALKEKNRIANAAARLVKEGDTLILDGSTTNIHIARAIKEIHNITVFTMSHWVMMELINSVDICLYCIGGLYSRETAHFVGSDLEDYIKKLHANKCIIGASAISPEYGITGPYSQLVAIQKNIIESVDEVILAADHTKWGKVSTEKVADINDMNYIIVDSDLDKKYIDLVNDKTNLILAD